ncbi:MAG: hypothetical protein LC776_15920 [Acidobacteria bacterium]|nr:hypothetical protein [Acidobacteriota bacterium]
MKTTYNPSVRQFAPKAVLLAEDTVGKGHKSAVVGGNESLSIVVQLAVDAIALLAFGA